MSDAVMRDLDECVDLIRQARINDQTRAFLVSQSTIYALFLSDLDAGRITPNAAEPDTVPSMLELITEFCTQVREIIYEARAA